MSADRMTTRIAVRIVMGLVVIATALFGSAGTWDWPEAWFYLALHLSSALSGSLWLKKHNPGLLEKRMTFLEKSAKKWDKVVIIGSTVLFIPLLIAPGLDVRYGWSDLPFAVSLVGFAGLIAAVTLVFWVMRVNPFASRVVEIQQDHKVVSTGPYRYVRHPMYVGAILLMFSLPVALGSLWALISSAGLTLLVLVRTVLEDKTLREELEGYADYARRVRYRLVPGLW